MGVRYVPETGRDYPKDHLAREFEAIQQSVNDKMSVSNSLSYHMVKGAVCKWRGAGASDPVLEGQNWNVLSVTRQGVGLYRVQLDRVSLAEVNIAQYIYPLGTLYMDDITESYQWSLVAADTAVGWFDIQIYELGISGQDIIRVPIDMGVNDVFWLVGLLNVIEPDYDEDTDTQAIIVRGL